jgi:hypothetical protein
MLKASPCTTLEQIQGDEALAAPLGMMYCMFRIPQLRPALYLKNNLPNNGSLDCALVLHGIYAFLPLVDGEGLQKTNKQRVADRHSVTHTLFTIPLTFTLPLSR